MADTSVEGGAQARTRWSRWFYPPGWSIAVKLSVTLLAVALLPMGVTVFVNLNQSLRQVTETEHRNLQLLAGITAHQMDQLIADTQRVVVLVASDSRAQRFLESSPAPPAPVPPDLQAALERIVTSNPDYEAVSLMDRNGLCVATTAPERLHKDFSNRDYFRTAMQGKQDVSDVQVGTTSNRAGLYFSAPVQGAGGQPIGALLLKVTGNTLTGLVNSLRIGAQGYAFVVDPAGVVIIHPNPKMLYRSLAPLPDSLQTQFANRFAAAGIQRIESLGLPGLAKDLAGAKQPGHTSYVASGDPARQVVGFAPMERKNWVVAVNESETDFTAPLRLLAQEVGISVLVVGAVVTILALLLARGIVNPVRSLTTAARALEKGNLDVPRVPVASIDEIGQLAAAFNTMAAGLRERQRERDIFGRVVSPEVREKLLSGDLALGGEKRRVAVLFSDIRGFSTLSEQLSPEEVVSLLNEYLTEMTAAVRPWGGYVNNFIGDAIVVIFGAPIVQSDAEWRAICAALAMRERLARLNEKRQARGDEPLASGIGISTGEVVAGQVGSLERLLYTVIGDSVNVAARLETLTKDYAGNPILMNDATAMAVMGRSELTLRSLGSLPIKGRTQEVEVYTVQDRAPVALAVAREAVLGETA